MRDSICAIERICHHSSVRLSVCPSVCHMHALQGCARDLSGRDQDETRDAKVRDRDKTETLGILSETRH